LNIEAGEADRNPETTRREKKKGKMVWTVGPNKSRGMGPRARQSRVWSTVQIVNVAKKERPVKKRTRYDWGGRAKVGLRIIRDLEK